MSQSQKLVTLNSQHGSVVSVKRGTNNFFVKRKLSPKQSTNIESSTRSTVVSKTRKDMGSRSGSRKCSKIGTVLQIDPAELQEQICISSPSLKRQISFSYSRGNKLSPQVGIRTPQEPQIPKNSSNYSCELAVNKGRHKDSTKIKNILNGFTELCSNASEDVRNMKQFCHNQEALERVGRKFFSHNQNEMIATGLKSGGFNPTSAIEKSFKEQLSWRSKLAVVQSMRQKLQNRIKKNESQKHYTKLATEFEHDSLFQVDKRDYQRFSQRVMVNNRFYNGTDKHKYHELYTKAQRNIIYEVDPQDIPEYITPRSDKTDDSSMVKEFLENTDAKLIQLYNYGTVMHNPFLDDSKLIKIMKRSNILKKQFIKR